MTNQNYTQKGYLPLPSAPSKNVTVTKGSIAKLSNYEYEKKEHHVGLLVYFLMTILITNKRSSVQNAVQQS